MSHPIEDYALIGDTHTTALVHRGGSIDWLCWPRHDSPALLLRLLDDDAGGFCEIVLEGVRSVARRYLPETNILETRFVTDGGTAVLVDLMPVNPPSTLPEEGPDGEGESRILRWLTCSRGRIAGRFVTRPTRDYARGPVDARCEDGTVLFACPLCPVRASGSSPMALVAGQRAEMAFALQAGEEAFLALTHGSADAPPPAEDWEGVRLRVARTRRYWTAWSARCTYRGRYRDAVLRSALCLKLLTHSPSGAIVAAPTASLPEAVPGNRNFDYRFCWLRDASFTVTSFVNLGYLREAAEYLRFLRERDESRGADLPLMHAIYGDIPGEEELQHLSGWNGTGPVRIGNAASGQRQHDIYGEFLAALHGWLEGVHYDPPQKVNDRLAEVVTNLADAAIAACDEPDQGIWELRGPPEHIVHSKAMVWVALDRAVRLAPHIAGLDPAKVAQWQQVAARVRADYHRHGWKPQRGAYTMSYESDDLDAAVLRAALFGAFDPAEPRFERTLQRVEAELGEGDLIYRYRRADGLEGQEAPFLACAFWRVGCLALAGHVGPAREIYERLLARANDVGLLSEEIEAGGGFRGNFPQGFSHMAVINHALRLEAAERRVAEAMGGPVRVGE